jgi:hypothetical protein
MADRESFSPLTPSGRDPLDMEPGDWLDWDARHGRNVREHVKAALEEHRVEDVRKTPERRQLEIDRRLHRGQTQIRRRASYPERVG